MAITRETGSPSTGLERLRRIRFTSHHEAELEEGVCSVCGGEATPPHTLSGYKKPTRAGCYCELCRTAANLDFKRRGKG